MLQTIRERTGKWVLSIIVGVVAVSMLGWGLGRYMGDGNTSNFVAEVEGQKISKQQLQLSYQQMKANVEARFGKEFTKSQQAQRYVRQQALQQLIESITLENAARHQGFTVNQQQLVQTIRDLPYFKENGQFSKAKFENFLKQSRVNRQRLFSQLHQQMLIRQPLQGLKLSTFLMPEEFSHWIGHYFQTRTFSYLNVPFEQLQSLVHVSEKALKAYYNQHKTDYKTPAQIKIDYITLSLNKIKNDIQVSEEEVKQYYRSHIDQLKQPAKWRVAWILVKPGKYKHPEKYLQNLHQKLTAGSSFEELARKHSQAKQLYPADNGWISEHNQAYRPISQQLPRMKKGEVSAPVKIPAGWAMVKYLDHKPAKTPELEQVKDKIRHQLINQKARDRYMKHIESLTDMAYRRPGSLKPMAEQYNLDIETSDWFGRDGGDKGIIDNENVVKAAFSDEVLKHHNNSRPIQVGDRQVVVLRLNDHKPQQVKPYSQVKDQVKQGYIQEQAQKKAKEVADKILKRAQNNQDYQGIISQYKLQWQKAEEVSRNSAQVDDQILQQAFAMQAPVKQSKYSVIETGTGYTVIKLRRVQPGKPTALNDKQKKQYHDKLESALSSETINHYIDAQMERSDIKVFN